MSGVTSWLKKKIQRLLLLLKYRTKRMSFHRILDFIYFILNYITPFINKQKNVFLQTTVSVMADHCCVRVHSCLSKPLADKQVPLTHSI